MIDIDSKAKRNNQVKINMQNYRAAKKKDKPKKNEEQKQEEQKNKEQQKNEQKKNEAQKNEVLSFKAIMD